MGMTGIEGYGCGCVSPRVSYLNEVGSSINAIGIYTYFVFVPKDG